MISILLIRKSNFFQKLNLVGIDDVESCLRLYDRILLSYINDEAKNNILLLKSP